MKTSELYASAPVRASLGRALRPGGEKLTRRMLELAGPLRGRLALDAGCGCGASLALLEEYGARAVGLDLNAAFLRESRDREFKVVRADLAELPLPDGCADLILCECVWNLTDKERVLKEFLRVLRPGGVLALVDIYARGHRAGEWPVRCCFAQATDLQTVMEQVAGAGFEIVFVHVGLVVFNIHTLPFIAPNTPTRQGRGRDRIRSCRPRDVQHTHSSIHCPQHSNAPRPGRGGPFMARRLSD